MDRKQLIGIFIHDLNKYRMRYKLVNIFNKSSIFTILLLIGLSTFLPSSIWVTLANVVSLFLYLVLNVIKPEKYKLELKQRINNLFEIISRLTKSQISEKEWDSVVDDIVEKGLLLEVQSQASINVINESKKLAQPQLSLDQANASPVSTG